MDNTNTKTKRTSLDLYRNIEICAWRIRDINATAIAPVIKQIESSILSLWPGMAGRTEDGAEDWTNDILGCQNTEEVRKVLHRISVIEHQKSVESQIQSRRHRINVLQNEVDLLKIEIQSLEKL